MVVKDTKHRCPLEYGGGMCTHAEKEAKWLTVLSSRLWGGGTPTLPAAR